MKLHGLSRFDALVKFHYDKPAKKLPDTFGRLLDKNPIEGVHSTNGPFDGASLLAPFKELVGGMEDETDPTGHTVAAGMTFFAQFVDHDITRDMTSQIGSVADVENIVNVRTPKLDLDCVYGNRPNASSGLFHPVHKGYLLFGSEKNPYDLARDANGTVKIGDDRNDENQIVSQLHGAFVCFHNIVMSMLDQGDIKVSQALGGVRADALKGLSEAQIKFEAARRLVRHHYQHLVVNQLLDDFVDDKVLKQVKETIAAGKLPKPFDSESNPAVMPIEFSGAAFRYGHATAQSSYVLNNAVQSYPLFQTGRDELTIRQDQAHNVEFKHLFDYPGNGKFQRARPIGPKVASVLYALPFETQSIDLGGVVIDAKDAKILPLLNLMRDRTALHVPSGQQVAKAMGIPALDAPTELTKHEITKTPLWYYCLQEAASHKGKLGSVGGTIVATVILRLLHLDAESIFCPKHDFTPWNALGATQGGKYTIGHMLQFVEKNRDNIVNADGLDIREQLYT